MVKTEANMMVWNFLWWGKREETFLPHPKFQMLIIEINSCISKIQILGLQFFEELKHF